MRTIAIALVLATFASASAQTLQETGSIYKAYPQPSGKIAPAPKGYTPIYISHYGRHGSRWITSDERYLATIAPFDSAHAAGGLTPLGEDVRQRLQRVNADALGRSGSLTPLGEKQHHDIAQRMINNFPAVFCDKAFVRAASSTSMRCAMSMSAFCEGMKELKPSLNVKREPYDKHMAYIAHTTPAGKAFSADTASWWSEHRQLILDIVHPHRLVASLFTDSALDSLTQYALMENLYWAAADLQNVGIDVSLYDIFTYDELHAFWRTINARMYACNADYPVAQGVMLHCADNLLNDIIEKADAAIAGNGANADLRFGHDSHLLRLLARMGIKAATGSTHSLADAHKVWRDYELSPMAANVQLIFYRNKKADVLVRILLNEEDAFLPIQGEKGPFYPWEKVKAFWMPEPADL